MAKKFSITQKANLNGTPYSKSVAIIAGAASDLDAFIANLEGKVTVREEVKSQGNEETLVTKGNFIQQISLNPGYDSGLQSVTIKPFGGGALLFKDTVSDDDIRASLSNLKPYKLDATAKPSSITVKGTEKVNQASTPAGA